MKAENSRMASLKAKTDCVFYLREKTIMISGNTH